MRKGDTITVTGTAANDLFKALSTPKRTRPTIVCHCGSTRFKEAFQAANLADTLAGKVVLSVGCYTQSDDELFADKTPEERAEIKRKLDALHLCKIALADEVLILNVGGYIGASTANELSHARKLKKRVRFLEAVYTCAYCGLDIFGAKEHIWIGQNDVHLCGDVCALGWRAHMRGKDPTKP